jgi:hypothetical protein
MLDSHGDLTIPTAPSSFELEASLSPMALPAPDHDFPLSATIEAAGQYTCEALLMNPS